MKAQLTTLAVFCNLLACSIASYGQGQIQFQNSSASPATIDGVPIFGPAGTFTYGLFLGPAGSTVFNQLTLVDTVLSPNSTSSTDGAAGQIRGGLVSGTGNANSTFQIIGGTTYVDAVAGWTTADGPTFQDAVNSGEGYLGITLTLGTITPTPFPAGPAQTFQGLGGSLPGPIEVTPEPSTIAIGALGVAAFAFLRRRR